MEFRKEVPDDWGYYWVLDIDYPDPFPAYVWVDVKYPFMRHVSAPCRSEIMWTGQSSPSGTHEHYALRFGDKIEKPAPASNVIEK